jgi:NhaP-type Na+/H+ or K+/H+ antiporter
VLVEPILEIVLSLALGIVMGVLFTFFEKFFHSRSKRLSMSVAFVFLTVALSMLKFELNIAGTHIHVAFSSLLVCMMLGTIFCNICDFSEELMDRVDRWTAPLFVLFFVLSGAELELSVFKDWAIVVIGLVYILARSAGKYSGAFLSAKAVKCDDKIVKYLGVTLLPQAGVALGMAMKAETIGPEGAIVANITLFAVLVYELVGPMLTKIALLKAGEIEPEGAISRREEHKQKLAETENK